MYKRWQSVCCNRVETFPPNKSFFVVPAVQNAPYNGAGGCVVGSGGGKFFLKNGKQHCSQWVQSNHKENGPQSTLAAYDSRYSA